MSNIGFFQYPLFSSFSFTKKCHIAHHGEILLSLEAAAVDADMEAEVEDPVPVLGAAVERVDNSSAGHLDIGGSTLADTVSLDRAWPNLRCAKISNSTLTVRVVFWAQIVRA